MKRGRWIIASTAFAAFLLVVAVSAIVVGAHDAALTRSGFGVASTSALLLVTGAVLLVAAYQLGEMSRRRSWKGNVRPPCKLPVLVAFLVTLLLGVYVLFSGLKTPSTQRPLVVAVAFLLVVVPAVGLSVFGRDARLTLPRLGAVALALVGTTIGAWEFWYQNHYVPSHAGSDVALNVLLRLAAHQKAYDVIHATLSYEDVGGKSVTAIGSTYTLTGSRVVRCHRPSNVKIVQGPFQHILPDPQRSRYMADVFEEQPAAVLAAGKFVRDGKRLDANVAFGRDLVFYVPRHRYQLLRFRAQLLAIPASVPLSQRTPPEFGALQHAGDNELYGLWHVDDDSWLHDLVAGRERWVILRYELVDPTRKAATQVTPDLRVTVRFPDPTWTKSQPPARQIEDLFARNQASDASEPFGDGELALEPVTKPNAHDEAKLQGRCRGSG